jgi:hypothetical protein
MVVKMESQSKPKPTPKPTTDAAKANAATQSAQQRLDALGVGGAGAFDPTDKNQSPVWIGSVSGPLQTGKGGAPASVKRGSTGTSAAPIAGENPNDSYISRAEAYQQIFKWYGTPKYEEYANYLVSVGLIDEAEKTNVNTVAAHWYDAVDAAANLTSAGKKVSPWDATRLISGKSASASGSKAGTQTSTTRSVNLTDPMTAKALVNDVLSRQLGRAARPDEVAAFTQVLNSAQEANPAISTETRTYDEAGNYSSSVHSSGGLDAAGATQVLTDKAMQSPDYGAYQAGVTYLNAFNRAIQSPVPG